MPPAPGVFSAFGLLCSDTEYVASRTLFRRSDEVTAGDIRAVLAELEAQARASLAGDGVRGGDDDREHMSRICVMLARLMSLPCLSTPRHRILNGDRGGFRRRARAHLRPRLAGGAHRSGQPESDRPRTGGPRCNACMSRAADARVRGERTVPPRRRLFRPALRHIATPQ